MNLAVDEVQDCLETVREQASDQQQSREQLLKQYWNRGKELSVLQENSEEFTHLQEENMRLKETQQAIEERLQRVLSCTKALANEYKP
jgi:K+-sensing histidine kinase KdpD